MHVLILTDLEGIAGINTMECVFRESPDYPHSCRLLEEAINDAGRACLENGSDVVYYIDSHGGGGNVNPENILPQLVKIDLGQWGELMAAGKIDCVIEIGSHARAGTMGGFLDHTVNSRQYFRYCVNGEEASELSMHAAFCGQYGVPIVAVTGDTVACLQAKSYLPQIRTAVVKHAEKRNESVDYPDAKQRAAEAIADGLRHYRDISPAPVSFPATLELTFYRTDFCEEAIDRCKARGAAVERVDARTLRKVLPAFQSYYDFVF